ncbi:MAG: N-6 DNA methylase [Alphaproteobacteria bacterium]|nr:N-6 DNA methylase [Alphaproteobacteria bacterium]
MPPTATKRLGATHTPPGLAAALAREMLDLIEITEEMCLLDPAVGGGALLLALGEALREAGVRRLRFRGWDEDPQALAEAERRLRSLGETELRQGSFLEAWAQDEAGGPYAAIIANPPWVRTQVLGAARAQALAAQHGLQGKVDLAWAFLVTLPELLAPGGVAGVLAPNRLLSTRSAAPVRARLRATLRLEGLWDLGDTRLFEAAVLPMMLVARAGPPRAQVPFVSVYETEAPAAQEAADPVAALALEGCVAVADGRRFELRRGHLSVDGDDAPWRLSRPEDEAWLAQVDARTWARFEDLGEARVGVKSTADPVFIHKADSSLESPLLRPLLTHHVAARYRARPPSRRILYPHEKHEGVRRAVDLETFPAARAWLESHRARLSRRGYLEEAGRAWYELWVPHDPEAWAAPKLVWRDISPRPVFWVDTEGAVVNGDCYWLRLREGLDPALLWLALGVANSALAARLYDLRFNNRLYAGRRRYLSQYVRRFPLPDPRAEAAQALIALARQAWASGGLDARGQRALDAQVESAFGLPPG